METSELNSLIERW